MLAQYSASATAVWAPTGLSIAALLIRGRRVWPGVFLGAFAVNATTQGTLLTSAAIAVGNTLEAVAACVLVDAFANGRRAFYRATDVFKFTLFAALLAPAVAATVGAFTLYFAGLHGLEGLGRVWFTWWLGDAVGAIIVAPAILLWSARSRVDWSPLRAMEAILSLIATAGIGLVILGGLQPQMEGLALGYLLFPLLLWPAFRFEPRETALGLLALAIVAVLGRFLFVGPVQDPGAETGLLLSQMFVGVIAITALAVSALVDQRRDAEHSLRANALQLDARVHERTAALAASEERWRGFADNAPLTILTISPDLDVTYANRIPDPARRQFVGSSVLQWFAREHQDVARRALGAVLAGADAQTFEVLAGTDRGWRWVQCHAGALREHGQIVGAIVTSQDVTELKHTLERLRLSRLQLTEAQRMAQMGSWEWNVRENTLEWSDELYRVYGLDPHVFKPTPQGFEPLLTAEDREKARLAIQESFTTLKPFEFEHRVMRYGEQRIIHALGRVELGADGKVERMTGISADVTNTRRAQAALVESERRFRELVQRSHLGIWTVDASDHTTFVNPRMAEMLGYEPEELLGKSVYEFLDEAGQPAGVRSLRDRPASDGPQEFEFVRRDGTRLYALLDVQTSRDAAGQYTGATAFVTDVTVRKRLEAERQARVEREQKQEALKRENQALEAAVRTRTSELVAALKEVEAFNYSVSHDLRTPIRTIRGFSDVLLKEHAMRLDEEGRRFLRFVSEETARMGQIVDALLDLSRVTRVELVREHIDLSALATAVASRLKQGAAAERVVVDIEKGLVAEGDGKLLKVVLENLFSNSFKFTAKHPQAHIEFGQAIEDGEHRFYVRDDGAGFDPANSEKLFTPFHRLHRASDFDGMGIGLATVQRIIARHGGRIWAEGHPEAGATFWFTLEGETVPSTRSPDRAPTPLP